MLCNACWMSCASLTHSLARSLSGHLIVMLSILCAARILFVRWSTMSFATTFFASSIRISPRTMLPLFSLYSTRRCVSTKSPSLGVRRWILTAVPSGILFLVSSSSLRRVFGMMIVGLVVVIARWYVCSHFQSERSHSRCSGDGGI